MIQTRYYQAEAKAAVYRYFSEKTGNPVVAMPTGTGKSIVIGDLIQDILQRWPGQRILMLTHVSELIKQNAEKLLTMWPKAPLGIYSASLKRKDAKHPIVYGGIKSVINNISAIGHRDLLLIDECHLVSNNVSTQYVEVILELMRINPLLKVIGFSATPYRMGMGYITDGGIFTDICYDITGVEAFNRLIAEGYLSMLIPRKTKTQLDVSSVRTLGEDYNQNQLQAAVNKDKITFAALQELLYYSHDRHCGLIFATGIEHAEKINEFLTTAFNQTSVVIHSMKDATENDASMLAWKNGAAKWAVSMNALTTGVDNPMIDVIGLLRPTISSVLWVQMLGRGTRPCEATGKQNCLVLDFAGNTERLGPINDPVIPRKKGKATGEIPVRICEACGAYNHLSARACCACGEPFEIRTKFKAEAATEELIAGEVHKIEYFDVDYVIYNRNQKDGAPATIRASYFCGMHKFNEWICLDHTGYARKRALDWLRQRIALAPEHEETATTDNVLGIISQLRAPKQIRVWVNKKPFPEVMGYEY